MQLKLRRSQRDGGTFSTNVIFCLDARAQYTSAEQSDIRRYKLHNQVIYNSEASKRLLEKGSAAGDGSTGGAFKSLAFVALAAMRLNITIGSLEKGQHIECKSLEELLAAEAALMQACENLTAYLKAAASFDGREVVVDFADGAPQLVASATPAPQRLIAPLPPAPPPIEYQPTEMPAQPDAVPAEFRPEIGSEWSEQPSPKDIAGAMWADQDMRRGLLMAFLIVVVLVVVAKFA